MVTYSVPQRSYQHQPDATLDQDNPVSTTWYTILDTVFNAHIKVATATVTWTVQPDPLEIRITIDGNVVVHAFTDPVTAIPYAVVQNVVGCGGVCGNQILIAIYDASVHAIEYNGKSIQVEARTTGGTVSNLSGRVKYELLR